MASDSSRRIPELDGLRGIACLMVLVFHYLGVLNLGRGQFISRIPGIEFLGASGVDLFFVLSGFLISGILFDNRNSPSYFRTFYVRRVCRIFPVYFLVYFSLLLVLPLSAYIPSLGAWLLKDLMPLWSYATFTQNFFMALNKSADGGGRWIAMTWSVAVEEQFYLLFPFVVYLLSRAAVRDLALTCIMGAACLRVLVSRTSLWYLPLLPCRVDCLAVGVLLAYAVREPALRQWARDNRNKLYSGLVMCGLGFVFFRDHLLGYTWLASFFGCILLIVVVHPESLLAWICRRPILQKTGLLSYGIYMYHQPVNGTLHALLFNQAPEVNNWGTLAATTASFFLVFLLATASYLLIERHFLHLGHRASWQPHDDVQTPPVLSKAA